jgi:glutamate synthase (NADPH/NADH) large chain
VLGDIGPWACAGMTGGRVYVRQNAFGIDRAAIERRLGKGAKVELKDLDAEGLIDVDDLLRGYCEELRATGQDDQAERLSELGADATSNFLMVSPHKVQADPSISTE